MKRRFNCGWHSVWVSVCLTSLTGLPFVPVASGQSFQDWLKKDREEWRRFQQGSGTEHTAPAAPSAVVPRSASASAVSRLPFRPLPCDTIPRQVGRAQLFEDIPKGDRIFFVKKQDVGGITYSDIYSMDPSGGDVRPATHFSENLAVVDFPEISQDGKRLAFLCNDRSWASAFYMDAFLMDLGSSAMTRITGDERTRDTGKVGALSVNVRNPDDIPLTLVSVSFKGSDRYYPAASARDLRVTAGEPIWVKAMVRGRGPGVGDVRYIQVQEGQAAEIELDLTQGTISAFYASVAPDHARLAVNTVTQVGQTMMWGIGIWDSAGAIVHGQHIGGNEKPSGEWGPSYSPAGAKLAYCPGPSFNNSLGWLSTDNYDSKPKILQTAPPAGPDFCMSPAWSPDGNTIVYLYGSVPPQYALNLYRVTSAGGTPQKLTQYAPGICAGKAAYSPDGTKVAFTVYRFDEEGIARPDIYVMPVAGGTPQALTTDGVSLNPTWGTVR